MRERESEIFLCQLKTTLQSKLEGLARLVRHTRVDTFTSYKTQLALWMTRDCVPTRLQCFQSRLHPYFSCWSPNLKKNFIWDTMVVPVRKAPNNRTGRGGESNEHFKRDLHRIYNFLIYRNVCALHSSITEFLMHWFWTEFRNLEQEVFFFTRITFLELHDSSTCEDSTFWLVRRSISLSR